MWAVYKQSDVSIPTQIDVYFGALMMKFLKGCLMLVGGFFTLMVVAALVVGGNQNKAADSGTSKSGDVSSVQSEQVIPVGTFADVKNDRAVQINSSEVVNQIQPNNEFMKPVGAKGGKLVVVYMTLKNTGSESGNMFWSQFQLVDSQGRKYDKIEDFEEGVSINTWLDEQGLENVGDQLFPGAAAKTANVFRVAPDASDLKMVASGKVFNIQ